MHNIISKCLHQQMLVLHQIAQPCAYNLLDIICHKNETTNVLETFQKLIKTENAVVIGNTFFTTMRKYKLNLRFWIQMCASSLGFT